MARGSARILDDDEEQDLKAFMLEACGIDSSDFFEDERVLTRENFEKNFIFLRKMVDNRSFRRAPYFVIGYLILVIGAYMPESLRYDILYESSWEHEQKQVRWLDRIDELERKIYLRDFTEKIYIHEAGQKLHPIRLIYFNGDRELYIKNSSDVVVGINQFNEFCKSGKIYGVKHILLQGWGLKKIPEKIFELKDLESLALEHNQLAHIPDEIINLKSLKMLFLNYNEFTDFPESLLQLPSLEFLSLSNNYISSLPESIKNFKSLKDFYIRSNNIKEIPPFLNRTKFKIVFQYPGGWTNS